MTIEGGGVLVTIDGQWQMADIQQTSHQTTSAGWVDGLQGPHGDELKPGGGQVGW